MGEFRYLMKEHQTFVTYALAKEDQMNQNLVEQFNKRTYDNCISYQYSEEDKVIYYNVTGYHSLKQFFQNYIDEMDFLEFIVILLEEVENLQNQLPLSQLIWNTQCIYYDHSRIKFLYHPILIKTQQVNFKRFLEHIIKHVNIIPNGDSGSSFFLSSYIKYSDSIEIKKLQELVHNILVELRTDRGISNNLLDATLLEDKKDGMMNQIEVQCEESGSEGETMVLDEEGQTDVLTSTMIHCGAYLIRDVTKEKIPIIKEVFRLGKDKRVVDYCVKGNAAVSRCHAVIMMKNHKFFIMDTNSTNHTYVNRKMLENSDEIELKSGTKVMLGNEVFHFDFEESQEGI